MDNNLREVFITAITTFGAVATAYIAARWHIGRTSGKRLPDSDSKPNSDNDSVKK